VHLQGQGSRCRAHIPRPLSRRGRRCASSITRQLMGVGTDARGVRSGIQVDLGHKIPGKASSRPALQHHLNRVRIRIDSPWGGEGGGRTSSAPWPKRPSDHNLHAISDLTRTERSLLLEPLSPPLIDPLSGDEAGEMPGDRDSRVRRQRPMLGQGYRPRCQKRQARPTAAPVATQRQRRRQNGAAGTRPGTPANRLS